MSFWKDMSMFPEAIWYLTLLVMNSWGHRRTWIPFSPVSLGMASPPVSLLRQNWGHLLVFCENFVNVNDKGNIQQFPSSRCGSVFDRAEWGHVGLCLEWQSFTHLSRKAIWSNKNPKGSWQLPGVVSVPQPKLSTHQVKELITAVGQSCREWGAACSYPIWKGLLFTAKEQNSRIPATIIAALALPACLVVVFMENFHEK